MVWSVKCVECWMCDMICNMWYVLHRVSAKGIWVPVASKVSASVRLQSSFSLSKNRAACFSSSFPIFSYLFFALETLSHFLFSIFVFSIFGSSQMQFHMLRYAPSIFKNISTTSWTCNLQTQSLASGSSGPSSSRDSKAFGRRQDVPPEPQQTQTPILRHESSLSPESNCCCCCCCCSFCFLLLPTTMMHWHLRIRRHSVPTTCRSTFYIGWRGG